VLSSVLLGLIINAYMYGFQGLKSSLFGIAVPVVLLFVLFYLKLIGAGDIKLFSAIGALMGYKFILYAMTYSFIFAGILSLFRLLQNKSMTCASNLTLIKLVKSTFYDFYIDIIMCCITSPNYFLQNGTKHTIRLSPAITMGTCIQIFKYLFQLFF
jgi:prepilin peptidase CpaA